MSFVDDRMLPLTRGQLDIWLAQQTGYSSTGWQLGLLARIEGTVERDLLERAIRQAVREAEPGRAAFFEVDGQVFQRAIDYPAVELAFYDLSCSRDPVQEARGIASSIQHTPMPLAGPLFKFVLFRTRLDEFYLFACCHHIVVDGLGMALVSRRCATIYSAIVSGEPIPPAYFGSLQDLVDCESEYEASADYLEDQAYWSRNLPRESGPDYRLPQAASKRDPSLGGKGHPVLTEYVGELVSIPKDQKEWSWRLRHGDKYGSRVRGGASVHSSRSNLEISVPGRCGGTRRWRLRLAFTGTRSGRPGPARIGPTHQE